MTHEQLNGSYIGSCLEQVSSEAMAKGVGGNFLFQPAAVAGSASYIL